MIKIFRVLRNGYLELWNIEMLFLEVYIISGLFSDRHLSDMSQHI